VIIPSKIGLNHFRKITYYQRFQLQFEMNPPYHFEQMYGLSGI
jgi:hypothetical protein